jgi:hypothetical protein
LVNEFLFVHFFNNDILKKLNKFDRLIDGATRELKIEINKGNFNTFIAVLEAIFLVQSNQLKYDKLFEYLNNIPNL